MHGGTDAVIDAIGAELRQRPAPTVVESAAIVRYLAERAADGR
jgi:hypothetical protein